MLKEKDIKQELKEIIERLNEASKAYYQEAKEIMSNYEYDALYDRLCAIEKETGIILSNSPTQNVGYEIISELPKEKHPSKMLSLDKTKDVDFLINFLGEKEGLMSWKLDGLTMVLTYKDGKLLKAVTRGNGEVGEVITSNAKCFLNVPLSISFKGELVLRGEAVISYPDFEKINEGIIDTAARYKNPRNLCSGSVRQLDPKITKERNCRFYAFSLVSAEGKEFKLREEQFAFLEDLGFDVVERKKVTRDNLRETVNFYSEKIETYEIPSDGLVLSYNDLEFSKSLGVTAKFPKDSIAFKWQDETLETVLREIEWSASRTGLINPVAIFDPVELEGTTVSRASVHNVSVLRELNLGIGDRITVYKANMIIPQIADNLTRSNNLLIPKVCPVCMGDTVIHNENGVKTLFCENPKCPAKEIKGFTHFVSREAMDIEGLSEQTIEKLVDIGLIKELGDIFKFEGFKDTIVNMDGFGEKSYENLNKAVTKAKLTTCDRLLYALGIPNFGKANAKVIASYCKNDWSKIESLTKEELVTIDGIGDVMADSYVEFFNNPEKKRIISDILKYITLENTYIEAGEKLKGLTFVITGSLNNFTNRDELKELLEKEGGKVSGSVSSKTSFLINNDVNSTSGKNKTAHELGIKIINEEEVLEMLNK